MAELHDEIKDFLETQSVGTFGTDLFIGGEPDSPMDTVTIFDTGGPPPSAKGGKEYPTIQVRVRNETYPDGWEKATQILDLLQQEQQLLATIVGRCFAAQSKPLFLGRGKNDEYIFVINLKWYTLTTPDES